MAKIIVAVKCDEYGMGGERHTLASHEEVGTKCLQLGWHHGSCGRVVVLWRGTAFALTTYLLATGQGGLLGSHWAELAAEAQEEERQRLATL